MLQNYCAESGGTLRGLLLLGRRVIEIIRFEGVSGFFARLNRILTRRMRGSAVADFVGVTKARQVFSGVEEVQKQNWDVDGSGLSENSCSPSEAICAHSMRPCVDVIVCVHNAIEDVKACLSSVQKHTAISHRVIIVDDGSNQETRLFLVDWTRGNNAELLRNEDARGYTLAANQGLGFSSAECVILLNSDTIVTSGWAEKMIACARSHAAIGLVGPLSNTASWQSIPEIEVNGDWASNSLPEGIAVDAMGEIVSASSARLYPRMSFLNGFCLLIKRAVIDSVGLFDEQSFAKGYGEENDYCLRARSYGYVLAVADDVYVHHAQSKSYGDARRKQLAEQAGRMLERKHGQEIITRGVKQCRFDRVLMGIRGRSKYTIERYGVINSIPESWRKRRILFVLPVSEAGGGSNVVITEARAMRGMGVSVEILNLSRFRPAFESSYEDLDVPVSYASTPQDIERIAVNYDVVVATANYTVRWLKPLEHHPKLTLGYYVQDYEALFYEDDDPQREIAVQSYSLIPGMRLFTKTQWNREEVYKNTGAVAEVVGPSVDVDLFMPRTQYVVDDSVRVRIAAMLRPSSPRRNSAGTIEVLLKLKQRFGDAIEIVTFGSESHGPPLPDTSEALDFVDYGHLSPDQAASLLETADIFIDMSTYQAMGLTAMEAMACGAAVVVPRRGGSNSFATHNLNAMVVDTSSVEDVVKAVSELLVDPDRRRALQERAIRDINSFYPEKAAYRILSYLQPH